MKSMIMVGILLVGCLGTSACFAQAEPTPECSKNDVTPGGVAGLMEAIKEEVTLCANLKEIPKVGSSCKTSKGFTFIRYSDGWKDVESDSIWLDEIGKGNQAASVEFCTGKDASLASVVDFYQAEKHGIREVFHDMGRNFWTADAHKEGERI